MNNTTLRPTYYNIADTVTAFSTTRHGGTGKGNYASFNINPYCGDSADDVAANRLLLAEELGVADGRILLPHQTHGIETRIIGDEFLALPENVRTMLLEGVDALLTDVSGVCIGVSTADCIPVLLYDEAHHAVAAIHAGWRGTLARIVSKTIVDMLLAFHSDPKLLKAVIGPGISQKNFEVGDEVYEAFEQAAFPMDAIAVQEIKRNPDAKDPSLAFEKKWHLDLPLCNRQQLMQAGIAEENIQQNPSCTYDDTDNYFSARRLGTESGRIYTGIVLR